MNKIGILNENIDDALALVKILLRNHYHVVLRNECDITTVIEYDYADEDMGGDAIAWLNEDEFVVTNEDMKNVYNDGYQDCERQIAANTRHIYATGDVTCYDMKAELAARANDKTESGD